MISVKDYSDRETIVGKGDISHDFSRPRLNVQVLGYTHQSSDGCIRLERETFGFILQKQMPYVNKRQRSRWNVPFSW